MVILHIVLHHNGINAVSIRLAKGYSSLTVPKLTYADRLNALDKAKIARSQRAELRERVRSYDLSLEDVFKLSDAGDEVVSRTPIRSILVAFPHVGDVRANEIMDKCKISSTRRVQGVGVRQRKRLLESVPTYSRLN